MNKEKGDMMEVIQEMKISSNRRNNEQVQLFHKVDNAMFCKNCGKQYNDGQIVDGCLCTVCGNGDFLKGDLAATLAGYISLNDDGKLKEYYKQRSRRTGKTMNVRRLVIWMLIEDGFFIPGDKKTEDVIYRCLWKKW